MMIRCDEESSVDVVEWISFYSNDLPTFILQCVWIGCVYRRCHAVRCGAPWENVAATVYRDVPADGGGPRDVPGCNEKHFLLIPSRARQIRSQG